MIMNPNGELIPKARWTREQIGANKHITLDVMHKEQWVPAANLQSNSYRGVVLF